MGTIYDKCDANAEFTERKRCGEASACEIRDKLLEFFSLIELCLFN